MALPRYIQARTTACGVVEYRFNPPQKLVDAGVVTRRQFGSDLKQVRKLVREDNQRIDEYYIKEKVTMADLNDNSTLLKVIDDYYGSHSWETLKSKTQDDYRYCLSVACKTLGRYKLKDITTKLAKKHYQEWLKRGVSSANHITTTIPIVFN